MEANFFTGFDAEVGGRHTVKTPQALNKLAQEGTSFVQGLVKSKNAPVTSWGFREEVADAVPCAVVPECVFAPFVEFLVGGAAPSAAAGSD